MIIPRLHLFELEDQSWFPSEIRDLATDYLEFIQKVFALHRPIVKLLAEGLQTARVDRVIDLCSGGGGPVLALQKELAAHSISVQFTLTDRFPNLLAFGRIKCASSGNVDFVAEPVDARNVPQDLKGCRTIFNGFHHFRPNDAAAVLRNAVQAAQPIAIFEISSRTLGTLLPLVFLTPLLVWLTTPWIRPLRWRRLLWTYVIPLVPLTCWWDGIVSQLRAYNVGELERLAAEVGAANYTWQAGQAPIISVPGKLTYLIGLPSHGR